MSASTFESNPSRPDRPASSHSLPAQQVSQLTTVVPIDDSTDPPSSSSESTPFSEASSSCCQIVLYQLIALKCLILSRKLNLLLFCLPLPFLSWSNDAITCVCCFFALLPLAGVLSDATEELTRETSSTFGGLINATFGNAVEVLLGLIALTQGKLRVVQSSMLGSILSNLLLVLGASFLVAGFQFKACHFNTTAAQTTSSLLMLSMMGLTVPAAFSLTIASGSAASEISQAVLAISRCTGVVLFLMYVCYLVFQLKTHVHLYADTDEGIVETELMVTSEHHRRRLNSLETLTDGGDGLNGKYDGMNIPEHHPTMPERRKSVSIVRLRALEAIEMSSSSSSSSSPQPAQIYSAQPSSTMLRQSSSHSLLRHQHSLSKRSGTGKMSLEIQQESAAVSVGVVNNERFPLPSAIIAEETAEMTGDTDASNISASTSTSTSTSASSSSSSSASSPFHPDETTSTPSSEPLNSTSAQSPSTVASSPKPQSESAIVSPSETTLTSSSSHSLSSPHLSLFSSSFLVAGLAVLIYFISTNLVRTIDALAVWGIGPHFVSVILLPIVANAAEHSNAIAAAAEGKMATAISVAVGSSVQIALGALPLLVLVGWIIGQPLTLYFQGFETVTTFICVIIVNAVIADGESTWLEGVLLLASYFIVAVSFYFYK